MTENRISVLHIDLGHACKLLDLPFHHKDPFDRLLIAQSLMEGVPLVGRDSRFDVYGVDRIW